MRNIRFLPFLFLTGICFAKPPTTTTFNPFTGKLDYITALTTTSIQAGSNVTVVATSSGVSISASGSGGGGGGYAVEPATVTFLLNQGVSASTMVINSATALGILSGASRARFRMAGILSLQNTNSDSPDSSGVFTAVASTSTGGPAFYTFRRASGTVASPVATGAGMNLGQVSAGGYGATGWAASSTGKIDFVAESTFTDSSQPTGIMIYTTPSGSTTAVQRLSIAANGSITATPPVTFSSTTIGLFELTFDACQAKLPGPNAPFISNSTSEASCSIYFDDTSTQSVTYAGFTTRYDGRPLYADIVFTSTATSGTMNWAVYTDTKSVTGNYDTNNFNTAVSSSVTVNPNSNAPTTVTIALTNTTTTNGQMVIYKPERMAGLSDTAVGFGRVKKLRIYE